MAKTTDKFYNMRVNLIKNGRIYAEKVAIQNVWEKDSNIFLDIYFHRLKKSFVFDSVFIHDILDVNREKCYKDIGKFVADFNAESYTEPAAPHVVKPQQDNSLLAPVKNDVILLLFMARAWGDKNSIKDKIIFEYIQNTIEAARSLSEQYLRSYIVKLTPDIEDFYAALKNIKAKQPRQAEYLLREIVKICLADGYLHYAERIYLADIIQTLRLEGLKLPQNLI